jgi:hypothetical protein
MERKKGIRRKTYQEIRMARLHHREKIGERKGEEQGKESESERCRE